MNSSRKNSKSTRKRLFWFIRKSSISADSLVPTNIQFYFSLSLLYDWTEIRCSFTRNCSRKTSSFLELKKFQIFYPCKSGLIIRSENLFSVRKFLKINSRSYPLISGANAVVLDEYVREHNKDFLQLLSLDLFLFWNSIIAINC